MKTTTAELRQNLIDAAWDAMNDRNDYGVGMRDLAEAAVDAIAAPETAAELERVREDIAELVGALKSLRSRPGHYVGCSHPDTPCTPGCLRINAALAKHARAQTSKAAASTAEQATEQGYIPDDVFDDKIRWLANKQDD